MSFFRQQLESWLKNLDIECDSVLDVGGGDLPVKTRTRSFKVREYRILDNDSQFHPDYFGDLNYLCDMDDEYDVVFCLEVFEYIWNPYQAMENLYSFVKPGGSAYLSFPTIYPLHNPEGIDYLRYTKYGVEKVLSEGGFKSWEITPREATVGLKHLHDFYMSEGMHPMKNNSAIYDIGYLVHAVREANV